MAKLDPNSLIGSLRGKVGEMVPPPTELSSLNTLRNGRPISPHPSCKPSPTFSAHWRTSGRRASDPSSTVFTRREEKSPSGLKSAILRDEPRSEVFCGWSADFSPLRLPALLPFFRHGRVTDLLPSNAFVSAS